MKRARLPPLLFFLISAFVTVLGKIPLDIQVVEFMGRAGHLVSESHKLGLPALGYEILEDSYRQDFTSPRGFLEALLLCLRLQIFALTHWDTCCSNWVWVSRSCRSKAMIG